MSQVPQPPGEPPSDDVGSDFAFLSGLARAPCFRETALYSLGGAFALSALHFHRNRDAMRSAETLVKSGCAFAMIHWVVCRKRYYDTREETYGALEDMKRKQARVAAARARAIREDGPERRES